MTSESFIIELKCLCQKCPLCSETSFLCLECRRFSTVQDNKSSIFCEKCGECYHKNCVDGGSNKRQEVWFCDLFHCREQMMVAATLYHNNFQKTCTLEKNYSERNCCNQQQQQQQQNDDDDDDIKKTATATTTTNNILPLNVKRLYHTLNRTNKFASTGTGGGMMGEITAKCFQRIVDFLKDNCEFNNESCFLDVGSGLGKPNFHVAIDPGVKYSLGIELCEYPWRMSRVNLFNVVKEGLLDKVNINFMVANAAHFSSLEPCTHVYSFDVGWDPRDLHGLSTIMNKSTTIKYFISYQKASVLILEYGFLLELIGILPCQMAGSSESHRCYIYRTVHDTINNMNIFKTDSQYSKKSKMIIHSQHSRALHSTPPTLLPSIQKINDLSDPVNWSLCHSLTDDFDTPRQSRSKTLLESRKRSENNELARVALFQRKKENKKDFKKIKNGNIYYNLVPNNKRINVQYPTLDTVEIKNNMNYEEKLLTTSFNKLLDVTKNDLEDENFAISDIFLSDNTSNNTRYLVNNNEQVCSFPFNNIVYNNKRGLYMIKNKKGKNVICCSAFSACGQPSTKLNGYYCNGHKEIYAESVSNKKRKCITSVNNNHQNSSNSDDEFSPWESNCLCGIEETDYNKRSWVACDMCFKWSHADCVNLTDISSLEDSIWNCKDCCSSSSSSSPSSTTTI